MLLIQVEHQDTWVILLLSIIIVLAPEVMCRQNHTFAVDYYALGVIGYEFMIGRVIFFYYTIWQKRPYYGRSRQEIRE